KRTRILVNGSLNAFPVPLRNTAHVRVGIALQGAKPPFDAVRGSVVGAVSSVVGNPWAEKAAAMVDLGDPAWRSMVCVETGNIADNEVRLAADDEHQMSTAISVDAGP